MSISTEASANICPNLTGLIDRTVIETVIEDEGEVPSWDDVGPVPGPSAAITAEFARRFRLTACWREIDSNPRFLREKATKTSEKVLIAPTQETWIGGVSTRQVDNLRRRWAVRDQQVAGFQALQADRNHPK
jgi:hypothetical protein